MRVNNQNHQQENKIRNYEKPFDKKNNVERITDAIQKQGFLAKIKNNQPVQPIDRKNLLRAKL